MKRLTCLTAILIFNMLIIEGTFLKVNAKTPMGPLRVKNNFPTHLMFLTPVPDTPATLNKNYVDLSLTADYASAYINEKNKDWAALVDMELLTVNFHAGYGLTPYLSMYADIPFVSMSGGFMDGFLGNFHDTFDLYNYGKEQRPKNEYMYYIKKDGKQWFQSLFGGFNLTDSTLTFKYRFDKFLLTQRFSAALAYAVQIPTGDDSAGCSSGNFDHGPFLLTRLILGDFVFYLNPSYFMQSDPETLGAEIEARNVLGVFGGMEWMFGEYSSLVIQANYYTPPFEETGIAQLDDDAVEFTVGYQHLFGQAVTLELAFSEDLAGSVPDFNLHFRLNWNFGL